MDMAVIEFCVEKHGKLKSNSFGRGDWDVFLSYGGLVATGKKGVVYITLVVRLYEIKKNIKTIWFTYFMSMWYNFDGNKIVLRYIHTANFASTNFSNIIVLLKLSELYIFNHYQWWMAYFRLHNTEFSLYYNFLSHFIVPQVAETLEEIANMLLLFKILEGA